jgi:hypothetical protein
MKLLNHPPKDLGPLNIVQKIIVWVILGTGAVYFLHEFFASLF